MQKDHEPQPNPNRWQKRAATFGLILATLRCGPAVVDPNAPATHEFSTPGACVDSSGCTQPDTEATETATTRDRSRRRIELVAANAVCNDGSPGIYYVTPGTKTGRNRWVIYLMGGRFCWDGESCDDRKRSSPELMTSRSTPEFIGGIQSTNEQNNPDFATANHVFLQYCSSDVWSGDRAASADTGGYHFRGRRIFDAVIDELIAGTSGLPSLKAAKEVLFAGSSAGGVGVLANADRLKAKLPNISVRALDDAGWLMDLAPEKQGEQSIMERMKLGRKLWRGTPDESCAKRYATTPEYCYFGHYAEDEIETPLFVYVSQLDEALLREMSGSQRPGAEYARRFAIRAVETLQPIEGAFAPIATLHTAAGGPSLWQIHIEGTSFYTVLTHWTFQRGSPQKIIATP